MIRHEMMRGLSHNLRVQPPIDQSENEEQYLDILQDDDRLEVLRQASLLDSPPEEAFDRLTTPVVRQVASFAPRAGARLARGQRSAVLQES